MTKCNQPDFSLVQMEKEWFWCSQNNALIGPFPSHEEAEKNAGDTLGIAEEEGLSTKGGRMTDDEVLKEYETALGLFPTYWDVPERNADPRWWTRILDRETRAWQGLHTQKLLNGFKYFDVVLSAHRTANSHRAARY